MGKQETNLTNKIFKYIKEKGAMVISYHGNEKSLQGFPDCFGCYRGHFFAIEIKVGNNKPRPNQEEWLKRIDEWYGGYSTWVNEENWQEKINVMINYINLKENGAI